MIIKILKLDNDKIPFEIITSATEKEMNDMADALNSDKDFKINGETINIDNFISAEKLNFNEFVRL